MPVTILNWIVPITILLCGMAFAAIRLLGFATERWGYALLSLSMGFSIMLIETERFTPYKQVLEDSLILLSILLACRALRRRLDIQGSLLFETSVMVFSAVAVTVSLVGFKSVRLETLSVEACCAVVLWASAWPFARSAKSRPDRILAALFLLLAFLLTGQCATFLAASPVGHAVGAWRTSPWGNMIQYTGVIGSIVLTFCVMLVAAEDAIERHRIEAHTDPMTNLLNRRGLNALLESRQAKRFHTGPTVVILADIDHFKTINDRFGHSFGDAVIKRFATVLTTAVGSKDCVARVGGEEFMILISGMTLQEAAATADRARSTFATERWVSNGIDQSFTASFGVSMASRDRMAIDHAIERADCVLYAAKQQGRNRVIVHQ
ncbi:MAG: GGDEF domain-containing protein [Novosphingobium sp.]|nr:GGDEF domain-containing protein [Novosphingobium sp.]